MNWAKLSGSSSIAKIPKCGSYTLASGEFEGGVFTYTLRLDNNGPNLAKGVTLDDQRQ